MDRQISKYRGDGVFTNTHLWNTAYIYAHVCNTYIMSVWYNHQGPGYLRAIIQRQNRERRESRGQSCEGVASPGKPEVGEMENLIGRMRPENGRETGGDCRRDMTRRSTDLLWTNRSRFLSLFTCQAVAPAEHSEGAPSRTWQQKSYCWSTLSEVGKC